MTDDIPANQNMPEQEDGPAREPMINLPSATRALVLINIAVFLLEMFLPAHLSNALIGHLAFIPARYSGRLPFGFDAVVSPVTYMFLHGGWMHIGVNVTALMAFGAGMERIMGARRMLAFYFLTGIIAAFTHALVYPHATVPVIGASGAISGLFGGILIVMADAGLMGGDAADGARKPRYKVLLPIIVLWILAAALFGYTGMPGVASPIAWTAHIGGFVAGLLLFKPCLRIGRKNITI